MIADEARVVARGGLAGLLLPPAVGALLVAIVGAIEDPVAARSYLSLPFVPLVFGLGVLFAGPLGLVGAVVVSGLAVWWSRRGHPRALIRLRLIALGAFLGASLGWVFSQWVFTLARNDLAGRLICVGGGLFAGTTCGFLSLPILGAPFRRLTEQWTRPA